MKIGRRLFLVSSAGIWLYALGAPAGAIEGFSLRATASGVTVEFDQPGSPIPAEPTGEFHQAYSEARHETGPIGHGLSSVLWPGSTAANAGSFFGFPNYPVRAEAFHPAGPPEEKKNEGGTFTMLAHSNENETGAATTTQTIPAGPAVEVGSLASEATSTVEGEKAVSTVVAKAQNIVLLAGAVTIDSVVTKATASSDGLKGEVEGKTVVSGVSTAAGPVVSVEGSGISLGGQTVPVNPGPVETGLEQLGITMRVARPVDKVEGADASRTMGGLVVTFAPGTAGAPNQTSVTYRFASVKVNALATQTPAALDLPALPPVDEAPVTTAPAGSGASLPLGASLPPPAGPSFAAPTTPATELASAPVSAPLPLPVAAVPVALGVIAGFGSLLGGRLLTGLAGGALTRGVGTVCPLEKR